MILVALALLAGLVVVVGRPDERIAASHWDASRQAAQEPENQGPSFEVQVVKPRSARPLFGLLPAEFEAKLAEHGDLGFDSGSPGAETGSAGHDRLELSADGWDLRIEIDGDGAVASGTYLVFPMTLAGQPRKLRCRPADPASGYLRTSARAASDELDGRFLVKLATCENVATGKTLEWPPAPLTVRGSFEGLPHWNP